MNQVVTGSVSSHKASIITRSAMCGCIIQLDGSFDHSACREDHRLITKRQTEQLEEHWLRIREKDSVGAYLKAKFQVFRELFG